MNSIISEQTLAKIRPFRAVLLRAAVWTFIGSIVLGAILILFVGFKGSEVFLKFVGSVLILAIMILISVNNFKLLESKNGSIQIFAILGLVMNILWAIFWIMAIWGVFDIWVYRKTIGPYKIIVGFSIMGKLTFVSTSLSALGFFASNIMNIKEYNKQKIIKPLKITAVSCLIYGELFSVITTVSDLSLNINAEGLLGRMSALAIFTSFIWVVAAIVACVFSANAKNSLNHANNTTMQTGQNPAGVKPQQQPPSSPQQPIQAATPPLEPAADPSSHPLPPHPQEQVTQTTVYKTDEQLRVEIEQKVRAEMIEKEIRAKLATEQSQSTPPQK